MVPHKRLASVPLRAAPCGLLSQHCKVGWRRCCFCGSASIITLHTRTTTLGDPTGNGWITANAYGGHPAWDGGAASGGRIAVYATNADGFTGHMQARGSTASRTPGPEGTVYVEVPGYLGINEAHLRCKAGWDIQR